jgi:alpha-amylase
MSARKKFAYGHSQDYFDHPYCIGFVRMGDASHSGCVVLISKSNERTRFVWNNRDVAPSLRPYLIGPLLNHGVTYE